ncbi:MAG: hypothetical protein R6V01_08820 [Thermoplasmatota archaeon]
MKVRIGLIATAVLLTAVTFSGCLGEEDNGTNSEFNKEGALEFSLKVVGTYFDNQKEEFYSCLGEELYSLEGGQPVSKEDVVGSFDENEYLIDEVYTEHTFEEYMETYEPRVLDQEEIVSEYPEFKDIEFSGWEPDDDDYLFIGYETKAGKEGFLWEDPLVFMVTFEKGYWTVKAFGG